MRCWRLDGRFSLLFLYSAVLFALIGRARADDWPQWLGADRDGVWCETRLLDRFPANGPKFLWRVPVGTGYSGPAVAADRVYVMDRQRARDERGQPRRASRKGIPGTERVLCLSAANGTIVWKHEYDCAYTISYPTGPRTTPLVDRDRVYTLGAMGNLVCLDAAHGKVRWAKDLVSQYNQEPPVWGFAAHPLIEGELLYCLVGGEGSAVVAFNKRTGAEAWRGLSSAEIGYSPPMVYSVQGQKQLFVWLSDAIYGLDPATGKVFWKQDYPEGVPVQRPAVDIITAKKSDDLLFLSTFYHGPMMLKLNAAKKPSVAWKGKSNNPGRPDGAHCVMASPVFKDGYGYAMGNRGDLRCFKADTGKQLWQSYQAVGGRPADCGTAFAVPNGKRFVLFNDHGDLIFAELSPKGYHEIDRAHILEPTSFARGRDVVWSHPAFAMRCVFARNDKEMVCVSLDGQG